ncbi:hypothetical protein F2A38_24760 [Pseudomonas chlororaphis]|uniref:Uncharacterized protein n=1 Tax=Pseudomonas chlororaphis TaxID=587753 RepID=A0AB34C389_9PSED|nr:hypothetical protein [Pseudomonas chlororaphis]KAA5838923.1 hypothetical protein F2A38_24760 [Pseudomonas chlororaphis]
MFAALGGVDRSAQVRRPPFTWFRLPPFPFPAPRTDQRFQARILLASSLIRPKNKLLETQQAETYQLQQKRQLCINANLPLTRKIASLKVKLLYVHTVFFDEHLCESIHGRGITYEKQH